MKRIYLSAPDVRPAERDYLQRAVESNWIAPAGPDIDKFEQDLALCCGREYCVALSSGTAALHLSLLGAGVGPGDVVLCSTLTFVASANAIHMTGAEPVFIDSEPHGWNIDPLLLQQELRRRAERGDVPAAVVVVDLYGQCALYDQILPVCESFGVPLIEDAAEALGATRQDVPAGSFGIASILSFNGNKIITSSGGGALLTDDQAFAKHSRHLATQAREPVQHYEHIDRGFNYRMSNLLAAFGRGQLETLDERVDRRRDINATYRRLLEGCPGVKFLEESAGNRGTFWLTTLTVDPNLAPFTADEILDQLALDQIEARPVWKPMHRQPAYASCDRVLNGVSDSLFANGLCLPSGSGMSDEDLERVTNSIRRTISR